MRTMGKLSGTVLILAGISLAAYTLSSQYEGAAKVTALQSAATSETPANPALRVAAETPDTKPTQPAAMPAPDTVAPKAPKSEAAGPADSSPASLAGSAPGARRVHPAAVVQIGEAPPRVPVGEPAAVAGPPLDRPALARQIQRQLKRIGCYGGQVTGTWSPSVRQAMTVLMDRTNASLPIDQPDPVLLAMVEGQAPGACSKACPAGQGKVSDGRCMPNALLASDGGKPRPPTSARTGADRKATQAAAAPRVSPAEAAAAPMEGRMSLSGPSAVPSRQATRPAPRGRATHAARPPSYRTTNARPRERYRAAQRPSYGFTGWVPFFLP